MDKEGETVQSEGNRATRYNQDIVKGRDETSQREWVAPSYISFYFIIIRLPLAI